MTLRVAAAVSSERPLEAAVRECARAAGEALAGTRPDFAFVFVTHHHGAELRRAGRLVSEALGGCGAAGCTGAWVAGAGRELEGSPGLAVLALAAPGAAFRVLHVEPDLAEPSPDLADARGLVLLADPFTFPAQRWLTRITERAPHLPIVGGLASGGQAAGQNLLLHQRGAESGGALAVLLEGDIELVPAVSQGCRPVGEPLVITRCEGSVILELRGKPASVALLEAMNELPADERKRFQEGAFLGRAIDARRSSFGAGDLLVRNLLGIDPKRGAVVVGDDALRPGHTMHLMVRDSDSAARELDGVMQRAAESAGPRARGGLMITCAGRGRRMFGEPDHDAKHCAGPFESPARRNGPFALAGFAANGEIGPVGEGTYLHGFTASVGLFTERAAAK